MRDVPEWGLAWWEVALRLTLGAVLGGVLGFERELDGKEAGTRTHLLLALGAAVFGVVSVGGFDDYTTTGTGSNVRVDVTRVASYVAAGVGFLGGGAILKGPDGISGLTTAASLWVAAAVGLAAGLGLWSAALAGCAVGLVALVAGRFAPGGGHRRQD
ncbi:MAG: MgtC/SapB family protein, partial [Acidimicrobiales bacterium]|nr:MgtC/SapB family protein [Acidimicrobiales bacterium]